MVLDEGETDWDVIVVDVNDPLAARLNDIEDIERHLPSLIRAANEWFRIYKIPDGKPANNFAFDARHRLMTGETPAKTANYELPIINLTIHNSPGEADAVYVNLLPDSKKPPAPIDLSDEFGN